MIEFDDSAPCAVQRATVVLGGWHLLVGCLLLNMTTRTQARRVLPRLFELVPSPEALAAISDEQMEELVELLTPLGLVNRRVWALCNMTEDFLAGKEPEQMRHVGQYALDSWNLFVRKVDVEVADGTDHELQRYVRFCKENEMSEIRLEFTPNDDGSILCRRFRIEDGHELSSVTYREDGLRPVQKYLGEDNARRFLEATKLSGWKQPVTDD